MTTQNVSNEIKATLRALEDRKEVLLQLKIEREFLRRDLVSLKEQGSNELKHSLRLKKHLEAIEESNKLNREQLESVSSIRHDLKKGTIRNVLSFSEDQVERYKRDRISKTATMDNKLQKQIEEYTKNRPLVMEYKKNEVELSRVSLAHQKLVEEVAVCTREMNAEKQLNKLLLQEKITEMAQHIQRYRSIDDKFKHPNKKAEKSAPSRLMAMMNQFRLKVPAQSSPASSQKEVPDEVMPETSSTSKYRETFDTKEASAGEAFDRGSALRSAMKKRLEAKTNPRTEAVNKQPTPKMQDVSKAQPFIQEDVRADHKEKSDSEKSAKHVMPRGRTLKAATESTDYSQKSQKSKKGKAVTFVDLKSSGSGFEMDYSKEGGVSTTNFKNAATNDMDMDLSLESEMPINDSDDNLQADDGENDENNFDPEFDNFELGFGASAEDAAGVHSDDAEFDAEFSSSMFRTGNDAQPTNDCDFDMNFMDDEIEDMNSIF